MQIINGMYKIFKLTVCLIFCFIAASAQNKSKISEATLNDILAIYKTTKQDAAAQKSYYKILGEKVDNATGQIREWVIQAMQEQQELVKHYKPGYEHKAGEMNLFPLWEEMPGPVPSLPEARLTNATKYQAYIDKVTLRKKQLSDMMQQQLTAQRSDQQMMIADAKAAANNNAVVQQMGGTDAVMNMSEAERKQAAQKAAEQVVNNPEGQMSASAGLNAMMKRMMNDPEYREAYNKMTDAQKQEELKKYMTSQPVKRDDKTSEELQKNVNNTSAAMNIDMVIAKCLQQMQEATIPYAKGTELANEFYYTVYSDIQKWYKQQYDALPLTEQREKNGLAELMKCRQTIMHAFQEKEAATRTILWNLLKTNTKIAFGEFNDMIGAYPWRKAKNASLVDYNYTEPRVAQAVTSLYDEMIRMTREAEALTNDHKGKQEQFEILMK